MVAVPLLLLTYMAAALTAIFPCSATFDEPAYLAGGYSYWLWNDYRLMSESGQLTQRWATLPLLLGRYPFTPSDYVGWQDPDPWDVGDYFLYRMGNHADAILFQARVASLVLSACLGLLVYAWSRHLSGPIGGLISLVLFVFCPTMLANGPIVQSDMASALFFTAATAALWAILQRLSLTRLLISCCALAGLFLAKLVAFIIVPVAVLLVVLRLAVGPPLAIALGRERLLSSRAAQGGVFLGVALLHVLVVWAVIWAAFGCRFSRFSDTPVIAAERQRWQEDVARGHIAPILQSLHNHRLLPEAYLVGIAFQMEATRTGKPAFLNGEYREKSGFFWFFPYCMLVKTPLALFGLLGLAVWFLGRAWMRNQRDLAGNNSSSTPGLYCVAPLLVLLAVYWTAVLVRAADVGHRYLTPVYPPLFILAGLLAPVLQAALTAGRNQIDLRRSWASGWPAVVILFLLLAFVVESLASWPHYLAYFNFLAGGPSQGYRHLVDSSLDWGQDLPLLKKWLEERGLPSQTEPVYLAYFGTARVGYYRIRSFPLVCFPPQTWRPPPPPPHQGGTYCISATLLQGLLPSFPGPWTADHERRYQELASLLRSYRQARQDPEALARLSRQIPQDEWKKISRQAREGAFARLCALLRQREPDAQVGHSILIYHLRDEEARRALAAPLDSWKLP